MLLVDWLHPLLRAGHYGQLLGYFGLLAFPYIGLRGLEIPSPSSTIICMAWLAPFLSLLLMLVSIAAMMGQSLVELEGPVVQAMILDTSIGWAFLLRMLFLAMAALLLTRKPFAAALLYALALATLPWNGHAAASEETLGLFHRINDMLHLIAAGLWFGAIGWFTLLVVRARNDAIDPITLLASMHRFAPFGIVLVAIVMATGIVNAQLIYGLGNSFTVLQTYYGQLLAVKILLVIIMLACARRHAALARKAMLNNAQVSADPAIVIAAARTSLTTEIALAVIVIAMVAALGLLSPMSQ